MGLRPLNWDLALMNIFILESIVLCNCKVGLWLGGQQLFTTTLKATWVVHQGYCTLKLPNLLQGPTQPFSCKLLLGNHPSNPIPKLKLWVWRIFWTGAPWATCHTFATSCEDVGDHRPQKANDHPCFKTCAQTTTCGPWRTIPKCSPQPEL